VIREGNDWFLDELRACLGNEQVRDLPDFLEARRNVANIYHDRLSKSPLLRLISVPEGNCPAWYNYAVFVADEVDLATLMENLTQKHGVSTRAIYPPLHEESIFRYLDDGTLGRAAHTLHRSLCLPIHAELKESDANVVAAAVIQELR